MMSISIGPPLRRPAILSQGGLANLPGAADDQSDTVGTRNLHHIGGGCDDIDDEAAQGLSPLTLAGKPMMVMTLGSSRMPSVSIMVSTASYRTPLNRPSVWEHSTPTTQLRDQGPNSQLDWPLKPEDKSGASQLNLEVQSALSSPPDPEFS